MAQASPLHTLVFFVKLDAQHKISSRCKAPEEKRGHRDGERSTCREEARGGSTCRGLAIVLGGTVRGSAGRSAKSVLASVGRYRDFSISAGMAIRHAPVAVLGTSIEGPS
eukprot:3938439-Rhodomonas_salina.1